MRGKKGGKEEKQRKVESWQKKEGKVVHKESAHNSMEGKKSGKESRRGIMNHKSEGKVKIKQKNEREKID